MLVLVVFWPVAVTPVGRLSVADVRNPFPEIVTGVPVPPIGIVAGEILEIVGVTVAVPLACHSK